MKYEHGGDVYSADVELDFSININPLGMAGEVVDAIKNAAAGADIYPDYKSGRLVSLIAKKHGVSRANVVVGNGASELILAISRMKIKSAVVINPTFSEYSKSLDCAGVAVYEYQMGENLEYNLEDIEKTPESSVCFICNPNNPTGKYTSLDVIKALAIRKKQHNTILVVDECFIDFVEGGESAISLISELDNIVVIRAFTKSHAMAGVRLGYAVGCEKLVGRIKGQLPMWNVSHLAQKAGEAAIEYCDNFTKMLEVVKSGRNYLENCLLHFGFKVYISDANFILFQTDFNLKTPLLEKGILIRDASNFKGLSEFYYRICVSTQEKNKQLIKSIAEVLQSEGKL